MGFFGGMKKDTVDNADSDFFYGSKTSLLQRSQSTNDAGVHIVLY